MSNFCRNDSAMAPEWLSGKISNIKNINILHIDLKQAIWRFRICDYFSQIYKFRDFMNTLTLFGMGGPLCPPIGFSYAASKGFPAGR